MHVGLSQQIEPLKGIFLRCLYSCLNFPLNSASLWWHKHIWITCDTESCEFHECTVQVNVSAKDTLHTYTQAHTQIPTHTIKLKPELNETSIGGLKAKQKNRLIIEKEGLYESVVWIIYQRLETSRYLVVYYQCYRP